jgi:hypothetical protein
MSFLGRSVRDRHGWIRELLLDRPLHHVLVDLLDPVLAEQLLEVLDRVGVRRPIRLRQPTEITSRCVVPDLILGLAVRPLP